MMKLQIILKAKPGTIQDYEKLSPKTKSIRKRADKAWKRVYIRTFKRFNQTNTYIVNSLRKTAVVRYGKKNRYSAKKYQIAKAYSPMW